MFSSNASISGFDDEFMLLAFEFLSFFKFSRIFMSEHRRIHTVHNNKASKHTLNAALTCDKDFRC